MNTPVQNLLPRLDRVRKIGDGKWRARCPGHDDKNPSLSITELSDQRLLINCFASCTPGEVLDSVGLGLADLYPAHLQKNNQIEHKRQRLTPRDALRIMRWEVSVVVVAAIELSNGDNEELDRLLIAARRIIAAYMEAA